MTSLFDRLQAEIETRQRVEGMTATDLLELPAEVRLMVNTLLRRGPMSAAEIANAVGGQPVEVAAELDGLVERGLLEFTEIGGERRYKARLAPRRGREVPDTIWNALEDKVK